MAGRIKPVFKCPESYKAQFQQATCLLGISVGQAYHEGERFIATIDLVNRSFGSFIINVCDRLQRYTLALETGQDINLCSESSLSAGDDWLARNQQSYEQLSIPAKVVRWDHWLTHPGFELWHERVLKSLADDCKYKATFDSTIDEFLTRYCRRVSDGQLFSRSRAEQLCLDYLVEECAALCLWAELPCEFEVYPGRRNAAMAATHQRFVLPQYPERLHAVAIKFKNRQVTKPQMLTD